MSRFRSAAANKALKSDMVSLMPTPFLALAAPRDFAVGAGTVEAVAKLLTTVRTSGKNQSALNRHPCSKLAVCQRRRRRCRENVQSAIGGVRNLVIPEQCVGPLIHDDARSGKNS